MTASETTLVQLFRAKEDLRIQMKKVETEIVNEFFSQGHLYNEMFQDEQGVVYKLVEPTGTFIEFKKLDYQRTRRPGETKGSLSIKEAEEAGFVLPKTGGT
jgi:hypothetical protein